MDGVRDSEFHQDGLLDALHHTQHSYTNVFEHKYGRVVDRYHTARTRSPSEMQVKEEVQPDGGRRCRRGGKLGRAPIRSR